MKAFLVYENSPKDASLTSVLSLTLAYRLPHPKNSLTALNGNKNKGNLTFFLSKRRSLQSFLYTASHL